MKSLDDPCRVRPLQLLLVVDKPNASGVIEEVLFSSGIVGKLGRISCAEALEPVVDDPLDAIVASFPHPDAEFKAMLSRIRIRRPLLPVVLVSGPIGEELTADLFRLGIADFVLGSNLSRLPGAIMNSIPARRFPSAHFSIDRRLNLFEAIARGSQNIVLGKDLRGRYLFVNEAACSLFDQRAEEILGRCDGELFSAAQAAIFAAADHAVIDGNCSVTQDEPYQGAAGEVLLHVTRGPIHDREGNIKGSFAVARDVSERRRLEAITQAHGRLLEMVATNLPLPRLFAELVRTAESMVSGARAAILTMDVSAECLRVAAAPSMPEAFHGGLDGLAVLDGMASCGTAAARKSQVLTEDVLNDPLWVPFRDLALTCDIRAAWSTPIPDASGQLLGILVLYRRQPGMPEPFHQLVIDMVTRLAGIAIERWCEEELIRKLQLAVEQNPNSIIITNTAAEIEYVNAAFERMSGYSLDEVKGKNPRMLQSGLTPPAVFEDLWQALCDGRSWQGEFINRRKNGELFTENEIFSPIRQPDGTITHYLCIKEDITGKKRDAEELDRHRHRLEELVAERTEQLHQAKEEAEAAVRAKGTFLANMSHEIRTPLNAIVGFTHLLRRRNPTEEQDGKLEKIANAADHLLSVINDILDISKIDAGKLVLEREPFDLEEMLTRICNLVIDRARAKGLELVVDIGSVPRQVNGDATRLGQALLNYLGNAVKFTAQGTIRLRAKVVEENGNDLLVRFEVEDSGIGIEAGCLDNLFEPFQQADQSITRQYGGTGLGLAISRNIARLMDGEVGASSTPGVGSLFWLTAWLGKAEQAAGREGCGLDGIRTLVVEDVAMTRMGLLHQLRQIGLRAEGVACGEKALEAIAAADAEGDPFALLLIDMYMPGLDGLDTLASVQALPILSKPVCFLVTASYDEDLASEGLRAGFSQVLHKPVSTLALHHCLLKHIDRGGAEAAPAALANTVEARLRRLHAGSRILLVEDEPINQMVAQDMLEDVGMVVDIANNGLEALEKLASNIYRIVLMDLQMPKMGGLETTRRIRQLPGGERLPIVAMTANAFNDDRDLCYSVGMNDFLPKPVAPELLFGVLLKWFQEGALVSKSLI
ncbi:MAG: response regulator [Azonexus sp.]|nr:response regulator [Azonexus sp.]